MLAPLGPTRHKKGGLFFFVFFSPEARMHACSFFVLLSLPIACLAWSAPIASRFPTLPSLACRLRGGSGASGVKMGVEVRHNLLLSKFCFLLPQCVGRDSQSANADKHNSQVTTTQAGDGKTYPKKNDQLTMHYTGKLTSGAKFDSSLDRGQPFKFQIGVGQVRIP